MRVALNGDWQFKMSGMGAWKKASVPGCNFLDLLNLGEIQDPFYGCNEKMLGWVAECDWEYRRSFFVTPEQLDCDEIELCCDMLDTICSVYVNGSLAGEGKNCHTSYRFPVKTLLHSGDNELRIVFFSPVKYVKDIYKAESAPMNSNGQNGIVHIRKPQYHFGWDWGPVLTPSGITGDIALEFTDVARLTGIDVTQTHSGNAVTLQVQAHACILNSSPDCELVLTYPDGKSERKIGSAAEFTITNPELWWTYELSGKDSQPLYTVEAVLSVSGKEISRDTKKIGLRTITLNRDRDEFGENFQFILNGVPLFIKGTNYIPPDSFINRFTQAKLDAMLDAVRYSNINMLRIWGGGFYGSDALYEACDSRGVLIWQDFCFACQAYPFFKEDFLLNVTAEVEYNVNRLKHHACLALWCGNNEIEDMQMAWAHMRKYVCWTEKYFYGILPEQIRKTDTSTPYIPGSPCGAGFGKGTGSDNVGDTHLWGVWHGLQPMQYYRRRMTRFCSEFGFESLPDIQTVARFAEPGDYSLKSDVMLSHQKCNSGNDKMLYYMSKVYDIPVHFEDIVYLSQIIQQASIADATEHWRRNKGRCNGSMYWQLNDCWQTCSWSSYDYYGRYKALQYTARYVNAPLSVSIEDTADYIAVYALNDYNEAKEVTVRYCIYDFERGAVQEESVTVELTALENREVFRLDVAGLRDKYNLSQTGFCARLFEGNTRLMQKIALFDCENHLKLPKVHLSSTLIPANSGFELKIKSDKYARYVKIENSLSDLPLSDNYFDLLPGEEKTVTIYADSDTTLEQQQSALSVMSLTDVEFDRSRLSGIKARARVYSSPMSVMNRLYHGRVPKDYGLNNK